MIKKRLLSLSIILIAFAFILLISFIHADIVNIDPNNPDNTNIAGINPANAPQSPDEFQAQTTSYVKQEWTKMMQDNRVGRVVLAISNFLGKLDFFWKPVLGMPYSFSWAFIFALLIWFILFGFIYPIIRQLFRNSLAGIAASFAIVSLIGLSGVISKAVDQVAFAIKTKWIAIITAVIAVFLVYFFNAFGKSISAKMKQQKEANEKDKTERAQKIIQTHGEISKKELDSYKNKGEGI